MAEIKERVSLFLKKQGMHYETIDIVSGCSDFIEEMTRGLNGEESSLRMICTYISPDGDIPSGESVVVMDAGGTNFRIGLVGFDDDKKPVIEYFMTYPMPGSTGAITRAEFYDTVSDYLLPVIDCCSKIGWCFSFPTEILPNKDGKLLYFDKEVCVTGMDGDVIGASLLKTLEQKGVEGHKSIIVLNDTVATLLAGKAANPDREFGSYAGFILGTGTNTCYIEDNRNITKIPELIVKPGVAIINTESGGFGLARRGCVDIDFDSNTTDPGAQKFEKMISGAYQGSLMFELIRRAIAEGLFSAAYSEYLYGLTGLSSRDLNDFVLYPYSSNGIIARGMQREADNDRTTMYWLIDAFIERAAKLTAINLAAVIIKSGKGTNPCLPVCIATEGTTFSKSALFRKKLDYYVKHYLNDQVGIFCEFVSADNAALIGTAIAALINS